MKYQANWLTVRLQGSLGGGVIQTTGSESTFVCLLAGRTEAIKKYQADTDRFKSGSQTAGSTKCIPVETRGCVMVFYYLTLVACLRQPYYSLRERIH